MSWLLPNVEEWRLPLFNPGIIVGDNCYMARNDKSGIFRWNIKTNRLELLYLNKKMLRNSFLYGDAVFHEQKIYFVPCVSDELLVYDINNEKCEHFPIDKNLCKSVGTALFFGGYILDDKLWLMPKASRCIACFNLKRKEFEYVDAYFDEIAELYDESWPHIVRTQIYARASIWMLLWESNVVIEFDLKNCSTKVYFVGCEGEQFRNIAFDGDCFWLSNQVGELLCWSPWMDTRRSLGSFWKGTEINFKLVGKTLWVFPKHGNEYAMLETTNGVVRRRKVVDAFSNFVQPEYFGGNELYLMPSKEQGYIRTIEINSGRMKENSLNVSDEDLLIYQETFWNSLPGVISEKDISMRMFINRLQYEDVRYERLQERNVGKLLYDVCVKEINK